jgi:hypothetical protein
MPSGCLTARGVCSLPQTIAAQAVLAIDRDRQAGDFLGTPARSGQAAGELRSASGTGEAARALNFQAICHQSNRTLNRAFHARFIPCGGIIS